MIGLDATRLPAGWTLSPLDAVSEVVISNVDKKDYPDQQRVKLCNYTDVYYRDAILDRDDYMPSTASQEQIERFTVQSGDVAITKDSETADDIGRPSYAPHNIPGLVYGYHLAIYRPFDKRIGRFMRYLFESLPVRAELQARTPGVTRVGLSMDTLRNLRVPLPAPGLASHIADYLDHETAEIDAAISDQIALIELLEERQRIQKYQLVTGRTLAMPRAAEVVRFWAELPLDWSLQKLQWHFDIGNGSTPSTSTARFWDQDGFPWLNSSVVNESSVVHPSRRVSQTALEELHLPIVPPGSLLMGITGQGKTRGMVTTLDIEATINQHLAYLTPRFPQGPISVEYLRLALDVAYPELRQLSDGNGGTKGALTCHMLQQFRVPVPPKDLQAVLVTEARRETAATAQAVADAESFIALARERRAALITAAVTGQIDITARNKPSAKQLEDDMSQGRYGRDSGD